MIHTPAIKKLSKLIVMSCLAGLGTLSVALKPKPSLGAERISFNLPVLGEFHISVDSLDIFAKEGRITQDFAFYARFLDEQTLTQLRRALQQPFDVDPATIFKISNAPIGEDFLKQIGEVIYTHPNRNGIYAIRAALLLAASDPEGLTAINVMRQFPTKEIQIDTASIFSLIKETDNFLRYNETTISAIAKQANQEIDAQQKENFEQLPDLRQPGSYKITQKTTNFKIERIRQTQIGFADSYNLDVDIYLPQDQTQPAPLAILTHGVASGRSHFRYLGEHLASHGYIVLIPEHIGSNQEYAAAFLRGELSVDLSPIEFYNRPLDITYLLNKIEKDPEFQGLINWQQVGILGHSFGGNTALSVAGAPINQERINQVCQEDRPSLNASMLLQCRASYLPPGDYNLRDSRIQAVVAVNPVTSSIFGSESMAKIAIPTMLLGGSEDIVTPFIEEQAHPFLWLKTPNKYLGVMMGGSHNSTSSEEGAANLPSIFIGTRPDLARNYLKAMSLAFFEVYLRDRSDYESYLSATYTQAISTEELPLYLVKSLTPEQLEQAYGDTPPTPPIPESVVTVPPKRKTNILAQIKQTRTLKIAMRSDSAPFGYLDTQENLWIGYCGDLADALGEYLSQKLNISSGIKVIKLPSSLKNRFDLVRKNTVHLECGPNTIRKDPQDISFSNPFFVSSTHFLVTNENVTKVNPDSDLAKIKIGVLRDSTTAEFIRETYPQAQIVYFQGVTGRSEAIGSVVNNNIDTLASEGVLLSGEIDRQNLMRDNYQLIPEKPLTCDFYGLILPKGDRKWRSLVNAFLRSEQEREFQNKWLGEYLTQSLSDADYCLNRLSK